MEETSEASLNRLGRRQLREYLLRSRLLADDTEATDGLVPGGRDEPAVALTRLQAAPATAPASAGRPGQV